MHHHTRLSKLMYLSWEIQRERNCVRSKALQSAWAITQNEDITVHYLVKKHSHTRYENKRHTGQIGLFQ